MNINSIQTVCNKDHLKGLIIFNELNIHIQADSHIVEFFSLIKYHKYSVSQWVFGIDPYDFLHGVKQGFTPRSLDSYM